MERNEHPTESNPKLVELLRELIATQERITFDRFMQEVLYHPEHGYYRSLSTRPGRSGDYLTAPEADPIFGQTLARQLMQMDELLGHPNPFTLREYGAGAGTLALTILDGLRIDAPSMLERVRYQPVEINQLRAEELRSRLMDDGFDRQLSQSSDEPFIGCVLANEFLDALPVHRIERRGGQLYERYVVWRDDWFAEEAGPPSSPEIGHYLETQGIVLAEGQIAEINLGLEPWIAELAHVLRRGYVLAIDYGYRAKQLYSSDYLQGTLRTYYQHTVSDDPFAAIGNQDLTAHVDFSTLERTATEHGLQVLGLTTQADFLSGAGIGELLVDAQREPGMSYEEYVGIRSAVIRMIDPGAMGRFRVLLLGREVPSEPTLIGLSVSSGIA